MGSKISKAVRPHVKADASVVPTSSHHTIDETEPRQDPALPLLPVCKTSETPVSHRPQLSHDDFNIAASTSTAPAIHSQQRRNSAPGPTMSSGENVELRQRVAEFEQFMAERRLMAIDYDAGTAFQESPSVQPAAPTEVAVPQCLICCMDMPKDSLVEVLKPCLACTSVYCAPCIKKMFLDACKDTSRMPPRCCVPLNIQQAKPYLTTEEVALFRAKYEEWSTPNPLYCPVPACSAFIPDRLLPEHLRTKTKRRVDSGVGTPKSETFACPTCEASICVDCRQHAHPGSMCTIGEFGLDEETAKLLQQWGYKKCPKCGHGVKRMFGCNHMACRCGAHFCWSCLENITECGGGCNDDDDEDEYGEDDEGDDDSVAGRDGEGQETTDQADPAAATQTVAERPRNLDGGGAHYWANTALDFGHEPSDEPQAVWSCHHSFSVYSIPFTTAFESHTTAMECVRCWTTIHASIEAPVASRENTTSTTAAPTRASRFGVRGRGYPIGRGRGRGRGRAGYAPPRGLFRADATIGTASHLTAPIPPTSQAEPATSTPMEDVQFSQLHTPNTTSPQPHAAHPTSNVFTSTPPTFSLAYECAVCSYLVCAKCEHDITREQEAEEKARAESRAEEERMAEVARQQIATARALEVVGQQGVGEVAQEGVIEGPQEPVTETTQEDDDDDHDGVCTIGFD
jgi:hypothetical protein